jgi:ParB/RepB/Spo0J family partition protein
MFADVNDPYQVVQVPMARIYMDNDFNCRGDITPNSVLELANDIKDKTLQNPISIQPSSDVKGGLPDGFDFRIVAGHRRFMSYRVLGRDTIPCMIKRGLSEKDALLVNLGENLKRLDLNLLEEAHSIKKLADAGIPRETVAREIGKSPGWVQVRFYLLEMPEVIQQEARAGILTQNQIKQLYSLKTDEARFEAVRKIKQAKERGEKAGRISTRKKKSIDTKKARQPDEIIDMSEIIGSILGHGIVNRALAWAAGNITSAELKADLSKERREGYYRLLLNVKTGDTTLDQLKDVIDADSEIKRRPFDFPDEF